MQGFRKETCRGCGMKFKIYEGDEPGWYCSPCKQAREIKNQMARDQIKKMRGRL